MKICVFSASMPPTTFAENRCQRAIDFLRNKNNEIILGDLFFKNDFYRSGTILERANEINELAKNQNAILLSAIGGTNTSSILKHVNYQLINKNIQAVYGYSDSTALLNAIINKCPNVKVFYGPALVPSFGDFEKEFLEYTYQSFHESLQTKKKIKNECQLGWTDDYKNWNTFESPKKIKKDNWIWKGERSVTGRLVGGNLNTILGTWGSEYGLKVKQGDLLFIEDSQKDIATMEKLFNFLLLNKVFEKINGLILGRHELFNSQNSNREPIDVLQEILESSNINLPMVANCNFSHTKPMQIIQLNKLTKIDFENHQIIQI